MEEDQIYIKKSTFGQVKEINCAVAFIDQDKDVMYHLLRYQLLHEFVETMHNKLRKICIYVVWKLGVDPILQN